MTTAIYLAPWQSITTPHGAAMGSRVLDYWTPGVKTSAVKANGVKAQCLTWIDADDPGVLDAIDKDSLIYPLFRADELSGKVLSLDSARRTDLGARLDAARIPTAWIGADTTASMLVKSIVKILLACQRLGQDYPEMALSQTFAALSKRQQDAILAMLVSGKVSTGNIRPSSTIGDVVSMFRLYDEATQWLDKDAAYSDDFSGTLSAWTQVAGTWAITSGTLRQTAGGAYRSIVYGTAMDSANYWSECVCRTNDWTIGVGPTCRAATGAVTYYTSVAFGGDSIYIVEVTGGGEGILATGAAMPDNATRLVRLQADGSNLTQYVAGSLDVPAVDASLTSGRTGIMCYGDLDDSAAYADNWAAQDLAVAIPFPLLPYQRRENVLLRM